MKYFIIFTETKDMSLWCFPRANNVLCHVEKQKEKLTSILKMENLETINYAV